jgi:hypothetical protein
MAYCNHPFYTQTNEALNQMVSMVTLKNICCSGTISLSSHITTVMGIHNYGHSLFMDRLFRQLGINMTMTLMQCLRKKEKSTKNYDDWMDVKVRRSKQQQKNWQEVLQERTNQAYGPRDSLMAGMRKKKRHASIVITLHTCKCGSNTHAQKNSQTMSYK